MINDPQSNDAERDVTPAEIEEMVEAMMRDQFPELYADHSDPRT